MKVNSFPFLMAPAFLIDYGQPVGNLCATPDAYLDDAPRLALSAAMHVSEGRVKLAQPAAERAVSYPLGASLDFKTTDAIDNAQPLRTALLLAIADALGLR